MISGEKFSPPAIPELGTASGFNFRLQDRGGNGHAALVAARNQLLGKAAQSKLLAGVFTEALLIIDGPNTHPTPTAVASPPVLACGTPTLAPYDVQGTGINPGVCTVTGTGTGVFVSTGTDVFVGTGTDVFVGAMGVLVFATGVFVGATGVPV